ncbi:MAG: SOS response-associated peptidase [Elusimicrobia bacterium]|nr:SOS response-associated peptidase [Elusimicrobiota bacterium]
MCGRYTQTTSLEALQKRFSVFAPRSLRIEPRYNLSPGQDAPVVISSPGGRKLRLLRWGLLPPWAKDSSAKELINARAETLAGKPSFQAALSLRRCLVLADGFYEWRSQRGSKAPVRFTLEDGGPFAFAGLWEARQELKAFAIVTTQANALVRAIHNRMPAILRPEDEESWLDPSARDPQLLLPLLKPYPAERMRSAQASARVNSPANDGPDCLRPDAAEPELFI